MNIFVGNLSRDVTDDDLKELFANYGQVKSAKVIRDMFSQESKGFGFVEMPGLSEAQKAMDELNTKDLKGKKITVNEARPRDGERRGGGGGNNRRGGSGGGGNRGGSGGGGGRRW
ncbi:MAG: RNA recognition motif domain-containing protein [Ignavibacteriaceae bacterium]